MAKYKVEITGINTKDLKVIKKEEMDKLFIDYQNGDLSAKEKIINGNLRLVLSILKKYNTGKYNMDDLFQIGCVGLIKAVDNFDLSYNCLFSTYAVPLIIGEVKRYIRDSSLVRVTRSMRDLAYKILSYKEKYLNVYGIEPSNENIAKEFGVEEIDISLALDSLKEVVSIFEPIYSDSGDTIYLIDQIEDKKELNNDKEALITLNGALKNIKEREKDVLLERYIVGKTQTEIAATLGISQAQVSRIEKTAISNIKKLIK